MIKVGIAGARGLSAIAALRAAPDVEITALCDTDEELLKAKSEELGIPGRYRFFDDMLASDIDAVIIATPMQLHVPQTIAALEAGKHVLCEVTAGVTMDELFWLIEAVERSERVYMLAENMCYTADNRLIGELVSRGMLGQPYYGECEYLHNCLSLARRPDGGSAWRRFWMYETRGAVYPTHSVGPMMMWFGADRRITEVSCFTPGSHNDLGMRADDTAIVICRLDDGCMFQLRVDLTSRRPVTGNCYQLQGTKGVFETPRGLGDVPKIALCDESEPEGWRNWRPLSDFHELLPPLYRDADEALLKVHGGGDYFQIFAFLDAVRGIEAPYPDVYRACEWTAVGLLSALSVQNGGRAVSLPDFRRGMPKSEMTVRM